MTFGLAWEKQKELIKRLSGSLDSRELESFLLIFAEKTGIDQFRDQAVRELVRITKPGDVVPEIYCE